MGAYDITLAFGSTILQEQVKLLLRQNSYTIKETEARGPDMLRAFTVSPPNLLLTDYEYFGAGYLESLRILVEDRICPVVIVLGDPERASIGEALESNENLHIIQKPVNKSAFINKLAFIIKNVEKLNELEKKIMDLKAALETRKIMDKAKNILMKRYDIDEEKAHRLIQKRSMDTGRPVRSIALDILASV